MRNNGRVDEGRAFQLFGGLTFQRSRVGRAPASTVRTGMIDDIAKGHEWTIAPRVNDLAIGEEIYQWLKVVIAVLRLAEERGQNIGRRRRV